jgi:hypothetical protein
MLTNPATIIRLECAATVFRLLAYISLRGPWLFAALFLVPDLSRLGDASGPRVGGGLGERFGGGCSWPG